VELSDRHFSPRSNGDLRGRERDVQIDGRGTKLDAISGDLTRNDRSRQGSSGGPITKDNTSIEYYCHDLHDQRIADHERTDLGRFGRRFDQHYARRRQDVDQHHAAEGSAAGWSQINAIEPSPHDPAIAYVAATFYKSDNFKAVSFQDYGLRKTWTKIVNGIPTTISHASCAKIQIARGSFSPEQN